MAVSKNTRMWTDRNKPLYWPSTDTIMHMIFVINSLPVKFANAWMLDTTSLSFSTFMNVATTYTDARSTEYLIETLCMGCTGGFKCRMPQLQTYT